MTRLAPGWLLSLALLGAAAFARQDPPVPALVFVSREPAPAIGLVPGLGPAGSTLCVGGRLLVRERDGRVRELLPAGRFHDVADPDVDFAARRVAFSACESPHGPWRIWTVRIDGAELTRATDSAADAPDEFDPCWIGDALLHVRAAGPAMYRGATASELVCGGRVLTFEPNGVLDPAWDARRQRVVFARWWFHPWRPAPQGGLVRAGDANGNGDTVNTWQLVSMRPLASRAGSIVALDDRRLAAGGVSDRRAGMGVQPAPLSGGGIVATYAANLGLWPRPGPIGLQRFGPPPSGGVRLAGAAIADDATSTYGDARGLAAPAACAVAALPGGSLAMAFDPSGRGDFGLWLQSPGGRRTRLVDLPGTLELDPAPIVRRPRPRSFAVAPEPGAARTFTYEARDVFAGAGAPARRADASLVVFGFAGDSAVRLREVRVPESGRVVLDLPADTPLFEMLRGPDGRALAGTHGPALVRGANTGAAGTRSRCNGCHLGHSARR